MPSMWIHAIDVGLPTYSHAPVPDTQLDNHHPLQFREARIAT